MDGAPNDRGSSYPVPAIGESFVSDAQGNPVREKSFAFALEIIKICRDLRECHEYEIAKQLIRSGTAIGAIVEEGVGAESRKDFLHKMSMAHKEARETHYWLRLLHASDLIPDVDLNPYLARADELVSLLTKITKTMKERAKQ